MKWLLLLLFCPVVKAVCPNPVVPQNGYLVDGYDGGNYIQYACNEGYRLEGSEENYCGGSTWLLEPPECIPLTSCPRVTVADVQNAESVRVVAGDGTAYGSRVEVSCGPAYRREPDVRASVCEPRSGAWEPPVPACVVPTCPVPQSLGLEVTFDPWYPVFEGGTLAQQGAVAKFRCSDGFVMTPPGRGEATCIEGGAWDPPAPTCTADGPVNGATTISVDVPPSHTTVELALVNVTCLATSSVNATLAFRWLYDEDPEWELAGAQLELREVRAGQAGRYRCEVRSVSPPDSASAPMDLIVHFVPRWENHAVQKFALSPSATSPSLHCRTSALPSPSFLWQRGGGNLTDGGRYGITTSGNESTLSIRSAGDGDLGEYDCVARNDAGTGRFRLQLLRPGIPDAPMFCSLRNVSAYTALIDCIVGYTGGEPLDFAVYKYAINIGQEHVDSDFVTSDDDDKMAAVTVRDLQPNSNYTILIYQRNSHGQSTESMGVYILTADGVPNFPDDELPMMIIVGAVCGGVLLIFLIVLTAVLCRRCRKNSSTSAPKPQTTVTASTRKVSDDYMMEETAGFGEPARRLNNGAVIGTANRAYKASSLTSIDQQRVLYENAPTLQRPHALNIAHQPGESQVGMDNLSYMSDQGSTRTEYSNVVERRQMADPVQRAHRLSADQPSLAGMGALSMLPDPCALRGPPLRTSVSPASTPAATPTLVGAAPSFQPEVPWEFPRERLFVRTRLGEGSFGEVWRARADGICGRNGKTQVAVKMLKEYSTPEERRALLKELEVMKVLQPHPNIIQLLGCCTQSEPLCIIMDLASNGSLETVLRTERRNFGESRLRARDLVVFCVHVASAMEYISAKNLLHRDLAARNVLVDDAMICKVCDFGSTRDVAQARQYESRTQRRLPLRWMAPESLLQCSYSVASDIWSFGILIWEILTLGSTPYPGMSGPEVMSFVQKGCRMQKPPHCSEAMYALMKDTWQQMPSRRPPFSLVRHRLLAILDDPQHDVSIAAMEDNTCQIVHAQPGEKC